MWLAILAYGVWFCSKCAVFYVSFNVLDNDLFITVLDATAIKALTRHCFPSSTFDHMVAVSLSPGCQLEKVSLPAKRG